MSRICDRCGKKPIQETIKKMKTDEEIDLCVQCAEEFEKFRAEQPKPGPGRPRKDEPK